MCAQLEVTANYLAVRSQAYASLESQSRALALSHTEALRDWVRSKALIVQASAAALDDPDAARALNLLQKAGSFHTTYFGYADKRTLERRIKAVEAWLAAPNLLAADKNAEYAHVIEIDLADLKEPVLCCPNDPDDAKLLSDVAGTKIDEVFIGSCMTNIGHFRAASKLL